MKKIGIFVFLIFVAGSLFAQLDEGKKMLNYERFKSAAEIFKSMLDKNPKNTEAAYWLGQTYLQNVENTDSVAAKELYQRMLQENPNDALMMVGMGQIQLMEGKTAEARNNFEAAINKTKKKQQAPIMLAVGRANIDTRAGDAQYAIEVLNQAADRDKKSAEIQIALGDAYRKLIDGGNAVTHYQQALLLDPNAAKAYFMMGRIYETQGISQENIYMNYYFDAIRADENYAPVYYWLYTYYYNRDVNQARKYLADYVAHADNDSKNCYAEASLLYVSKLYDETIEKADACIAGTVGERPFPNLYGLKAYAYDKKGDREKALELFKEFFSRVNPDLIGPNDYLTYGKLLLADSATEELGSSYIQKAVDLDTVPAKKIEYITDVAKTMYAKKNYKESAKWYKKLMDVDPNNKKVNLFWVGVNSYLAKDIPAAEEAFKTYREDYPEDIQGWYYGALVAGQEDPDNTKGTAKPYWEGVLAITDTTADKQSVKQVIIVAAQYMVAYYYTVEKDAEKALEYNNKILDVDPENDSALKNKAAFEAYLEQVKKSKANNK